MIYFFGYYSAFSGRLYPVKYATIEGLPIGGEFDVRARIQIPEELFESCSIEVFEGYLPYETLVRLT